MTEAAFQARWTRQQEDLKLPSLKELGDTVEEKPAAPAGSTRVPVTVAPTPAPQAAPAASTKEKE
jgi:hypothetical protein